MADCFPVLTSHVKSAKLCLIVLNIRLVANAPHTTGHTAIIPRLSLLATLVALSVSPAQQAPSLVGTWILTGADKQLPDGTVLADYGPNPHGQVIFTSDGYYSVLIYRDEQMKFASGDKSKGTPEEYKDATLGMSDHFGRYSVDPVNHTI